MTPDPKYPRRVRDPELLRVLHIEWRGDCVLEGMPGVGKCRQHRFGLHHVHNKPRDDVRENLVMLCGDGTTGHHGLVTAHYHVVCRALAHHLLVDRLDTIEYLGQKLGGVLAVKEWLNSQLHASL